MVAVFRRQTANAHHRGHGHQDSESATQRAQQHALRKRLLHQPPRGRPQRRADRHFPPAPGGTRQQQVGHVGAGDQQQKSHGHLQGHHSAPHRGPHILHRYRKYARAESFVELVLRLQPLGDHRHFGTRLLHRHAVGQSREHVIPPLAFLLAAHVPAHRDEYLNAVHLHALVQRGQMKIRGQHAGHFVALAVEPDRSPHDPGIAAEPPLKEGVAQKRHLLPSGHTFIGAKEPAV